MLVDAGQCCDTAVTKARLQNIHTHTGGKAGRAKIQIFWGCPRDPIAHFHAERGTPRAGRRQVSSALFFLFGIFAADSTDPAAADRRAHSGADQNGCRPRGWLSRYCEGPAAKRRAAWRAGFEVRTRTSSKPLGHTPTGAGAAARLRQRCRCADGARRGRAEAAAQADHC